jgi:hypothetical protein
MNADRNRLWAALAMGLALVLAAAIWGRAFVQARHAGAGLTVKGTAETRATSVLAVWTGSVAAQAVDRTTAVRELEEQQKRVTTWLESQNVPATEWQWLPLQVRSLHRQDEYGNDRAEIEAWRVFKTLRLESTRVKEVAALALRTESLLKEGVNWASEAPQFYLGSLDSIKLDLLGKAAADARSRAQILAGGESRLGALVEARQGILQVTPPNSVEVNDYGMYSTETIEKTVKAVVTVTFALEP